MSYIRNNYVNLERPTLSVPIEPLSCRAGLSSFWINWKGNMTPCVFMEQPGIPVFEKGFAKSWEYIQNERDKILLPAKCTTCGKRSCCTVCGAYVLTETGGYVNPPEYLCKFTDEKMRLMKELHHLR